MKPVIEVRNLSKSYTINHKDRASYNTIKDDFSHLLSSPFSKRENREEEFWALKNISFDIMPGEIFGIIGRNGSGKSTLLKILSRVVEPTSGTIRIHGKTASLLEVGTGFHPELTGRENIFFNGSMLGLSRKEIRAKFDEIVAFSEVEKFIDTPVKFYSSGMYVRLAFSVAAHLEPDILILDEVLAVGDDAFQKKSMKKIRSTMENGTTVLFVSHSMTSVETLCSRAMLLEKGTIKLIGVTEEVSEKYLDDNMLPVKTSTITSKNQPARVDENYGSRVTITELKPKRETHKFYYGENLVFSSLLSSIHNEDQPIFIGIGLNDMEGKRIFTYESPKELLLSANESLRLSFRITNPILQPGDYSISIGLRTGDETLDFIPEALDIRIDKRDAEGVSHKPLHDPITSGYVVADVIIKEQDEK